jgi:hypothetical protein
MIDRMNWQKTISPTFTREDRAEEPSPVQLAHLLKVAQSVSGDARQAWTELWSEFRKQKQATNDSNDQGFEPSCGWSSFFEKFWLLKHHIDNIERICDERNR